jgi:phosphatidylserine decarboxylase
MLHLFDYLVYEAPDFGVQVGWGGLIAFPFNAVINWPMTTQAGAALFTHPAVNAQLKKIFDAWATYLHSKPSAKVLRKGDGGWLSDAARKLLAVPNYQDPLQTVAFYDAFKHGPGVQTDEEAALDPYYGYTCWDDFFVRQFKDGIRPVEDKDDYNVIVAGCESDVMRIYRNVKPMDTFWVKEQPYSMLHILNHDPHYSQYFIKDYDPSTKKGGATVFQAFLSAKNYHRWHTPVGGRILKTVIVPGTYFAVAPSGKVDPAAPDQSQPYIVQTATRALIFIDADGGIGLMCFVAVGMSEVSTCELTVATGETIEKGDQLGMFHHGGSTHCLIFPNAVGKDLTFHIEGYPSPPPDEWTPDVARPVLLGRKIATYTPVPIQATS